MEANKKVLIVSAHGRGHWLAIELARKQFSVRLVDISASLGPRSPEDREGPFGYFATERITSSQMERLVADESSTATHSGLVVWIRGGPVELKSPVTMHRLEQLHQDSKVSDYLLKRAWHSPQEFNSIPFENRWLVDFSHSLAASRYYPAPQAHNHGWGLPLMAGYSLRYASRVGLEKSLKWLESSGVEVIRSAQLLDVANDGKTIQGLEIQSEKSGLYKADWFVVHLSSEELNFISKECSRKLLKSKVINSEWAWVRYRLRLSSCREREVLPISVLFIDTLDFSWTHENLIILRRTASQDDFDCWVRIPNIQRFQKQYLENIGEKIISLIQRRAERLNPQIVDFPQEYSYTYNELGPSLFPIYPAGEPLASVESNFSNLNFDSPEAWINLSWEGQFEHQAKIDKVISDWRLTEEEKRAKREKNRDREV